MINSNKNNNNNNNNNVISGASEETNKLFHSSSIYMKDSISKITPYHEDKLIKSPTKSPSKSSSSSISSKLSRLNTDRPEQNPFSNRNQNVKDRNGNQIQLNNKINQNDNRSYQPNINKFFNNNPTISANTNAPSNLKSSQTNNPFSLSKKNDILRSDEPTITDAFNKIRIQSSSNERLPSHHYDSQITNATSSTTITNNNNNNSNNNNNNNNSNNNIIITTVTTVTGSDAAFKVKDHPTQNLPSEHLANSDRSIKGTSSGANNDMETSHSHLHNTMRDNKYVSANRRDHSKERLNRTHPSKKILTNIKKSYTIPKMKKQVNQISQACKGNTGRLNTQNIRNKTYESRDNWKYEDCSMLLMHIELGDILRGSTNGEIIKIKQIIKISAVSGGKSFYIYIKPTGSMLATTTNTIGITYDCNRQMYQFGKPVESVAMETGLKCLIEFISSINKPVIVFYSTLKTNLKEALIECKLREEFQQKVVGYINLQSALKIRYHSLEKFNIAALVQRMTHNESGEFDLHGFNASKLIELQTILQRARISLKEITHCITTKF